MPDSTTTNLDYVTSSMTDHDIVALVKRRFVSMPKAMETHGKAVRSSLKRTTGDSLTMHVVDSVKDQRGWSHPTVLVSLNELATFEGKLKTRRTRAEIIVELEEKLARLRA